MSFRIVWPPASKDEYADLLSFVELNHGVDAALKLLEKTDKVLEFIAANPEMFPASDAQKAIRKAVITKQTSLFYRITGQEIQLLHFWDNRRDPNSLKFLL
jgi:plasmid stabilization system protein ParE